jgi:hypothetical protein
MDQLPSLMINDEVALRGRLQPPGPLAQSKLTLFEPLARPPAARYIVRCAPHRPGLDEMTDGRGATSSTRQLTVLPGILGSAARALHRRIRARTRRHNYYAHAYSCTRARSDPSAITYTLIVR